MNLQKTVINRAKNVTLVLCAFLVFGITVPVFAVDNPPADPNAAPNAAVNAPPGGAAPVATPAVTPEKQAVCDGINLTGGTNACDPAASNTGLTGLVTSIIGILSWVVGVAAVIMIMVGGFKYITSQGDGNSIGSAKNTILYAVVGLVVALFAQLIVRFVINKV